MLENVAGLFQTDLCFFEFERVHGHWRVDNLGQFGVNRGPQVNYDSLLLVVLLDDRFFD